MVISQYKQKLTMKHILFTLLVAVASIPCYGFSIETTRFHCSEDTTKINTLLKEGISADLKTPNQFVSFYADKLLGTPYVAHTLEGDQEFLTINIDELDCTTFVETLMALTMSTMQNSPTWYTYAANLEKIRYHNGKVNGYASRLHYISAWIVENTARGFIEERTSALPHAEQQIKTLNYMSRHRDSYPALKEDKAFQEIKELESGYNMHMFPYIKKTNLHKKDLIADLKDGDIICLTTKTEGLDVSHLGIIRFVDEKPHLLHASSKGKKVMIDKYDLYEMLRASKNTGIRVIRIREGY